MIAYNADSSTLLGLLYHYPASSGNHPDKKRLVYCWDTGAYLGSIPEAASTFNVVGNTNSEGLTIAETTFGGIRALASQNDAILDYGSLIYITLQRATTAREAIHTMTSLMDTYGYASDGETFSLADSSTGEVWMMEVIGRGKQKKGAVWVAVRIPDGAVAAHANQARITTFPRNDPDNCMYADDVVELALHMGLYQRPLDDPTDSRFSFSDTYDPLTYAGVRACEARVWSIFSNIMEQQDSTSTFQKDFTRYVTGKDYSKRMPLYITVSPSKLLTLTDVDDLMSSHYERSPLQGDDSVGAGMYNSPYRPRPLSWEYKGSFYSNERPVATQQTAWNFISQISPSKAVCSTILWFGLDDSSTSPRVPVYGCATALSDHYVGKGSQDGVPSAVLDFDINKAFWVQNMVSNFAYDRWKMAYPILKEKRRKVMNDFMNEVMELEKEGEITAQKATSFTVKAGDKMHQIWWAFYGELFAKFRDYYSFEEKEGEKSCGCTSGLPDNPVFDDPWKKRIVEERGEWYKVNGGSINDHSDPVLPKKKSGSDGSSATPPLRGVFQERMMDDEHTLESLRPINKFDLKALQ